MGNYTNCINHTGALYNPYHVSTSSESGYLDDCTSTNQQRCAMGDLSGKLGALRLEPLTANPRKTYSFYDDNLHLLGPLTSEYNILLITLTFVQLNQNVILTQVIHHFTKLKYVQYLMYIAYSALYIYI